MSVTVAGGTAATRYQRLWAARFDELDEVVAELKQKEAKDGRTKR